mmetsp:Transcript_19615/g.40968  ORF Transcript_19615/g.40968 Transcript_19615/m.40968 type:complete len:314 (+) Transcript_19615:1027-1968(+)
MILDGQISHEVRLGWQLAPVQGRLFGLCLRDALPLLVDQSCVVLLPDLGVLLSDLAEVGLLVVRQQGTHHRAASACIQDVDDALVILGGQLHSSVALGGRGTANHQRHLHVSSLHLFSNILHLVQRWSDQPGETDHVHLLLDGFVQDVVTWHHDAHVDHLVVVATQHHANNVLTDVVHVTLHGGHQHHAVVLGLVGIFTSGNGLSATFFLHERSQVCDSLLHHARALDDLRQEHLTSTEEISDDAHSLHQWSLNDVQRNLQLLSGLLGIALNELVDAVDEPVVESLSEGARAPSILGLLTTTSSAAGRGCRLF